MKRFIICIMVFVLMLWFSGNSVHAKTADRLQVNSAEIIIDMEASPPIFDFYIVGLNFGDAPQVSLGNYTLEVTSNDNEHIVATVQGDITPGAYRLSVARKGFDFSHPEKADSLDVSINDAKSGESEKSSGALKWEDVYNVYEVYATTYEINRLPAMPIPMQLFCKDENDIALNGGYEIITNSFPESELTIVESNLHYIDQGKDYYKLVINNPHKFVSDDGMSIQIDAYLRCITIPGPDN